MPESGSAAASPTSSSSELSISRTTTQEAESPATEKVQQSNKDDSPEEIPAAEDASKEVATVEPPVPEFYDLRKVRVDKDGFKLAKIKRFEDLANQYRSNLGQGEKKKAVDTLNDNLDEYIDELEAYVATNANLLGSISKSKDSSATTGSKTLQALVDASVFNTTDTSSVDAKLSSPLMQNGEEWKDTLKDLIENINITPEIDENGNELSKADHPKLKEKVIESALSAVIKARAARLEHILFGIGKFAVAWELMNTGSSEPRMTFKSTERLVFHYNLLALMKARGTEECSRALEAMMDTLQNTAMREVDLEAELIGLCK